MRQPAPSPDFATRTPLSGLAQYCLPAAGRDDARKFAWANSICAVFLAVGLSGVNVPPPRAPAAPPAPAEIIPALFEPPPAPPTAPAIPTPSVEPTPSPVEVVAIPEIVTAVAADTAAVSFAVPVEGRVALVPAQYAPPPPPARPAPQPVAPPRPVAPAPVAVVAPPAAPKPQLFTGAGTSGDYPVPSYPREALRRRWQGSVLLLVEVDVGGLVSTVKVRESSGYGALDEHAADWVRQRWLWAAGPLRQFLVPFAFKLE